MNGLSGACFALALATTRLSCGTTRQYPVNTQPTATATSTASSAPALEPLDCDALCAKANTVAGCVTDPANVPACVELCARMRQGACKTQVEAELACAPTVALSCRADGTVDWGACSGEQHAANECARALPP